jgi:asparagine synthase (glutamine-hydrolysing)
LSIIDLSPEGNQPLYNEDKSLVLVCNGEIYNYEVLRRLLTEKGHQFSSHSDSEVILHLYEEYRDQPEEVVNALNGMFAFALWDVNKKRLFIARDRVGIKPLYFSVSSNHLIFSSEVSSIVATGIVDETLDITSLYEYFLLGSVPGPNTFYEHIKCLEAGNFAIVEGEDVQFKQYWDVPLGVKHWKSADEVADAVDDLLTTIVKEHLAADVPVGSFLSAGIDSSLITAIAVQHHPGIHTFTASFPGEGEDEGEIANATANVLKTSHHSYELTTNFFLDFDTQFKDIDQPFAIPSALSLGRISYVAKKEVKVVLSGDGADELFAGYWRHKTPDVPNFLKPIPSALHDTVISLGVLLTGNEKLKRLREHRTVKMEDWILSQVKVCEPRAIRSFFSDEVWKDVDTERYLNRIRDLLKKRKGEDSVNQQLYIDVKTTLVDEMLTKCDRMTMINGIEGRVPFLDHRLVELAFSIPGTYKKSGDVGKLPLRKLLEKRLGKELAYRKKTGFNSPLRKWLSKDKQTIAFVLEKVAEVRRMKYFNPVNITDDAITSKSIPPTTSFAFVCLAHYFKRKETNVK